MPRRTGPAVGTAPLPTQRVSPNAPAGAFGGAPVPDVAPVLGAVAQVARGLVERERQKADNTALRDADNQMSALRRSLLEDAESGYFATRGRTAMESADTVQERWREGVSKIEASLATEEQRARFSAYAQQQHDQMATAVQRHLRTQIDAEEKDVAETTIASAMDDVLANYQDGVAVGEALDKASATMRDFARGRGVRPEVIDQQVAAWRSKVLVSVVGRYLDAGQDLDAHAFYEQHRDEIVGSHREPLERSLQQGSTEGEAQRRADAIIATPDVTRAQAFETARQIEDPGIRKATEQRLDVEFARRDRAEAERYSGVLDQAWASVYEGRRPSAAIRTQLKLSDARAIDVYLRNEARGVKPETDPVTYYTLLDLASSSDPADRAKFRDGNLLQYRNELGESAWTKLVDMQMSMKRGDAKAVDRLVTGVRSESQVVSAAIANLGLKATAAPGTKMQRKVALFRKMVDDEVVAWKEAHNNAARIPTPELEQIIDRLVIKDEAGLVAFDELTARDPEDVTSIADVPLREQQWAREFLARQRGVISNAKIVELYKQRLQALRVAP